MPVWCIGFMYGAVTFYQEFGSVEMFYATPVIILFAVMLYLPVKISYDDTTIIVSDWLSEKVYEFKDIKSLKYSKPSIPILPYLLLEITTSDDELKKIRFLPRSSDSVKSLFAMKLKGRQLELLELWRKSSSLE
jgi:hypothetical protein